MDLETYKQDEKQMLLQHTLTQRNIDTSTVWRKQVLNGEMPAVQALLKAVNEYARPNRTCLDLGSADGPQYFGLKKFYPEIKWTGCEISQDYIDLFINALKIEGITEEPKTIKVIDYKDLSSIPDNSYDVVTSRSALSHYTPEHAFIIIDEMLRVCSKAVIIKFYQSPNELEDRYVEGFANMENKGYFVFWSKTKWDNYIKDKKVTWYSTQVVVIEK